MGDAKPVSPAEHVKLLEQYLLVAPYLVPPAKEASTPTLRHPDLHPGNVFIDPSDSSISGVIDWQHSAILPLFICAGIPVMFDDPDADEPMDAKLPKVPDNLDTLDENERYAPVNQYRRRFRMIGYIFLTVLYI
jgi:hypothetical protein